MDSLTDSSPMPFGMHKGKKMQDVPAEYLHWFYHNGGATSVEGKAVMDYIDRSITALKQEVPDLIWKNNRK